MKRASLKLRNTKSNQPTEASELNPSMISLTETEYTYLMQVDLPSLPIATGEIVAKSHDLTVKASELEGDRMSSLLSRSNLPLDLLSIHTIGGKIKSFYQEGVLYILLPKMHEKIAESYV